mmetsp:Transcript_46296/g.143414  ORF Transcript_46296/g.143414 Transcript_46296/m.143414 type:complete len:158 (-) Transcript_46296:27-500(-)
MGNRWWRLLVAIVGFLGHGVAKPAPAPPAPPPPPPPEPPAGAAPEGLAPAPPPLDPDEHMHQSRERHLRDLAPTSVHHQQGLWVYGDYKSVPEATTPVDCSKACEADEGCLHWNFHVVHHKCDLKSDSSGHNDGVPDWISGNAMRYKTAVPPKQKEL